MVDLDRCPDCAWPIVKHFRRDTGEPIGCPRFPRSVTLAPGGELPRVSVRIGAHAERRRSTSAETAQWSGRKGHRLVTFAACREGEQILVWDLETDDQWWGPLRVHLQNTGPANRDQREDARGEIEYQLGYAVLVVSTLRQARGGGD